MDKTLVVIIGPHAVGKMTVGQELAKITGLKLFHNHMTIEIVRNFFSPYKTAEGEYLNHLFRKEIFETVAKSNLPGLIFTYMFEFDLQSEYDYILNLIELYEKHNAKCFVVELCADFDIRLIRNKTENRLLNKESKRDIVNSEAEMRYTSSICRLNSFNNENLPFKNYIKIDNTNIAANTVALMIKNHFDI